MKKSALHLLVDPAGQKPNTIDPDLVRWKHLLYE